MPTANEVKLQHIWMQWIWQQLW